MPDDQTATGDHELLAAERDAALRQGFARLPPAGQRLLAMLIADPPVPYAQISAKLGIPVRSIGPGRRRYLDRLRRDPAIAGLISAQTAGGGQAPCTMPVERSLRTIRSGSGVSGLCNIAGFTEEPGCPRQGP
jgi:hypothetical protein